MESPLVSVIIPCYNKAETLREAVDSVLNGGYDNVEIIIVDDGSDKPGNDELLRNFTAPKTRLIRQQNQGVSVARNVAIGASSGKYILPLDADDIIAKGFIGKAVEILEQEPDVCVVGGQTELFGHINKRQKHYPIQDIWDEMRGNHLTVSCVYRRSDYDLTEGYLPEMWQGMEDWEFWISLMEKTQGRAVVLDSVALYYRKGEVSLLKDLIADRKRKHNMLAVIIRRHLEPFLSRLDVLADFICQNYYMGEKNPHFLPDHAKVFYRKYIKYKKLTNRLIVVCSVLALGLLAIVLKLVQN